MNYLHHPYAFAGHAAVPMEQPMAFDPAMTHPSMMHPMDGYMYAHPPPPPFDMMDFYHQPIMDYEEYAENLSRPRLTKEQVETLEAQFQAHPKPSSNVKRQLAAQTNLSLPRVAVSVFFPFLSLTILAFSGGKANHISTHRTGSRTDGQRPSNRDARRNSNGCKRPRLKQRRLLAPDRPRTINQQTPRRTPRPRQERRTTLQLPRKRIRIRLLHLVSLP